MLRKFSDAQLKEILNGKLNGKTIDSDQQNKLILEAIKNETAFWYLMQIGDQEAFQKADPIRSRKVVEDVLNDPRIKDLIKKEKPKFIPLPNPEERLFGQIFETRLPVNWEYPYQERRLVLVLSGKEGSFNPHRPDIKVAPISFETKMADPLDVIVENDQILGDVPFLVRLSDVQNIFEEQLGDYFGKLPEKIAKEILSKWKQTIELPSEIADSHKDPEIESQGSAPKELRYAFWKKEHEITRYMREPVQSMITSSEQWSDAIAVDLNYWLPEEVFENYVQREEFLPIAAASRSDLQFLALEQGSNELAVFSDNDILCELRYTDDWFGLAFALKENVDIFLKIYHNKKIVISEKLTVNEHITFLGIQNPDRLFNKELLFEIQVDRKIITKRVVLQYGKRG